MAKISEQKINEILSKTDIVDLIGEKVTLQKKGKGYFGLCPFHNEKTPSFSVEPERKIYNCFSCGEKGNAITFLQKTSNLSFVEAIEDLADRANVEIDLSNMKKVNPLSRLYNINEEALNFYKLYLSNTKPGTVAKKYLEDRGISNEIIQSFEFGLAPAEFELLTKTLTSHGILVSDLYDLGLSKQSKKETFYDLFRERIIIPIKDEKGNTVAFSGRTYLDKDKDSPKYINSPQTKVFTKSNILYNLHNALNAIRMNNRVVLFEGYMDVIAAHRAGIKESVASMGTSLTKEQVKLMKKYTNNVVICYDGDKPGIEATERAITLFANENMQVLIVNLEDGLDPDDYITKYGVEKLANFINDKSIDIVKFKYNMQLKSTDLKQMLDIERLKKNVFDLIKNTSHTNVDIYLQLLAQDAHLSDVSVRQDYEQYTRRSQNQTGRKRIYQPMNRLHITDKFINAERCILNYFMEGYRYVEDFNANFDVLFFISEEVRDIKIAVEDLYIYDEEKESKVITLEELQSVLSDDEYRYYLNEVKYTKNIDLRDDEYMDFKEVLHYYFDNEIQIRQIEKEIALASSSDVKIALAIKRDSVLRPQKGGKHNG
ncbi:DNA primase [Candidatus Izimaplasma bacterium HR1]|jgi:DNA primase|uniref:DNA primase n=1 Tax=Candidatus Izimoplasma sp. HR1 TaxID=1541959 RepID=UPI0004F691A5|nr:DNA primase [Candidatus Izimaplasma bacterium HR1]